MFCFLSFTTIITLTIVSMDRSQLSSLKRSELQLLARRENVKANLKSSEIIRLLLKKYPGGIPELAGEPPASRPSTLSSSKAKRPTKGSKRKSIPKPGCSVKAEEANPDARVEPLLSDRPHRGRDVRSMAPPPVTPTESLMLPAHGRLPTTPRIDATFEMQPVEETDEITDAYNTDGPQESTPTPPEPAAATSHQTREMLRHLAHIINTTSLNPEEPSSILYRAKALSTILDATIVPRMMRVDKEVKDFVYMRVAVERRLGPRFKEKRVPPEAGHIEALKVRPDHPAPHPPSPKRSREEGNDRNSLPIQTHPFKRTRV